MKPIRKSILLLQIVILIFSCGSDSENETKEKIKGLYNSEISETTKITDPKLQEKYLVGKWDFEGNTNELDGLSIKIEGEIEFDNKKRYDGLFSMKLLLNGDDLVLVGCRGEGKWEWNGEMAGDIDYNFPGDCKCSYKSFKPNLFPERKLRKQFGLCKDGVFLISEQEEDNSEFSTGDIDFYKNKILIKYKDYSEGLDLEMVLIKKD